jgi:Tol biopolymer transport system component
MPDGKTIVFGANRVPDADYTWRQSDIYSVDVAGGTIRQLTTRNGPDGQPTPSRTAGSSPIRGSTRRVRPDERP